MGRNARTFLFIMAAVLAALIAEPFARNFIPSGNGNG